METLLTSITISLNNQICPPGCEMRNYNAEMRNIFAVRSVWVMGWSHVRLQEQKAKPAPALCAVTPGREFYKCKMYFSCWAMNT